MMSLFGGKPKPRAEANELLRHAAKVLRYRSDAIKPAALEEIGALVVTLRALLADKSSPDEAFAAPVAQLDKLLKKNGGKLYPLGAAADWTETLVIAAILAGGVRAFIFQPFKIPTNSMYPTFHGMTTETYADDKPEPSVAQRALRKIAFGATHIAPAAPAGGEIWIPLHFRDEDVRKRFENKTPDDGILGTGIWKGPADRHIFLVGDRPLGAKPVAIVTPEEFAFRDAWLAQFFPKENALKIPLNDRLNLVVENARKAGDLEPFDGVVYLRTHKTVKAGEPVMRFDVLTGDMVIVDRVSYNFVAPKVGDAFVFRTRDVPGFKNTRDDFYIKRLVGAPGDTLKVTDGKLFRNGSAASGNIGFDNNNAHKVDLEYYGYTATIPEGEFDLSDPLAIPAHNYWAMGDNSTNSSDSRKFGFVPDEALVGRSLFILYPFTNRTGPSK